VTRQPDFRTAPRPSRGSAWGLLCLAVGVLALGASAYLAASARAEATASARHLADVTGEVKALAARAAALSARPAAGAERLRAADAPPARIVADVAAALPPDVRLDRLAIDYERGGQLELGVVARSAPAWDRLLERLERAPRLREVEPGPEARDGEVRSAVRARWSATP
jgi:Tfp pilus assembly protein PilN